MLKLVKVQVRYPSKSQIVGYVGFVISFCAWANNNIAAIKHFIVVPQWFVGAVGLVALVSTWLADAPHKEATETAVVDSKTNDAQNIAN